MNKMCDKCNFEISSQNYKKHFEKCDGIGPRRKVKRVSKGRGKGWLKGMKYTEAYGEERAKEIINKITNSDGYKERTTKDLDKEKKRREKISNAMKGNTNWVNSIHKTGIGKKGWYKNYYYCSSWELAWIVYNIEHDIYFIRNTEKFEYTFNDEVKFYIPDFICDDIYVEIKGYNSEQFKSKLEYFPHKIKVLYEKDMDIYIKYVIEKYGKNFTEILMEN